MMKNMMSKEKIQAILQDQELLQALRNPTVTLRCPRPAAHAYSGDEDGARSAQGEESSMEECDVRPAHMLSRILRLPTSLLPSQRWRSLYTVFPPLTRLAGASGDRESEELHFQEFVRGMYSHQRGNWRIYLLNNKTKTSEMLQTRVKPFFWLKLGIMKMIKCRERSNQLPAALHEFSYNPFDMPCSPLAHIAHLADLECRRSTDEPVSKDEY
eukprot:721600-Hanusia_phi.AAC.4